MINVERHSINPVTDWSDARRVARLRSTRLGSNWRRFGRLRRGALRVGLLLIAMSILCAHYYALDVQPERQRLAMTHPRLHHIHDAQNPLDSGTAVVDLVGLGNVDASDTARSLPAFTAIGQVWAVQYDNAGLDTAVISRLVTQHARRAGVSRIVVAGHSMGGIIALEVAEHLYEDGDLEVRAVILDCTPIDLHAVRAESRDAGEDMLRWMGWVPGARESRALRLVVETAARRDRYLFRPSEGHPLVDTGELTSVVKEVLRKKLLSDDTASNGLIESQFKAIVASGAQNDLQTLTTESGDRTPPAIIFMRPAFGADDPVVDVDYSQQVLLDDIAGTDAQLLVVRMAGTGHANPKQQPGIYNAAIDTKVAPFLDRMDERADTSVTITRDTDVAGAVSSP